jgi:hypothetical protein
MDLNEKLAQRRKEREQEAAAVQAEIAAKETAKTAFVKQEARKQLADAGLQQVIDSDTQKAIQKEKDQMIEKMAQSRWTGAENFIGVLLLAITIWGFFENWLLGVILLLSLAFYASKKSEKYKKQIILELKKKNSND